MKAYKLSSSLIYNPENGSLLIDDKEQVFLDNRLRLTLNKLLSKKNVLVSKQELLTEVWDNQPGAENSLHNAISQLRKYLRDEKLINTHPKLGYSYTGSVEPLSKKITLSKKYAVILATLLLCIIGYSYIQMKPNGYKGEKPFLSAEEREKIDSLKQLSQFSDSALNIVRKKADSMKYITN